MDDADGKSSGTYSESGNSVTLRFGGTIIYSGTISGQTMSGTATNGDKRWNWNVKR